MLNSEEKKYSDSCCPKKILNEIKHSPLPRFEVKWLVPKMVYKIWK